MRLERLRERIKREEATADNAGPDAVPVSAHPSGEIFEEDHSDPSGPEVYDLDPADAYSEDKDAADWQAEESPYEYEDAQDADHKFTEAERSEDLEYEEDFEDAEAADDAHDVETVTVTQPRRRAWLNVVDHPLFVSVVTVWGAALLGLSVIVLSSVDIARLSMILGLGALGDLARFVYAALAAVIGALGAFVCAKAMVRFLGEPRSRSAPSRPSDYYLESDVRPIDPALELGSESLDAPLEETPFSSSTKIEEDANDVEPFEGSGDDGDAEPDYKVDYEAQEQAAHQEPELEAEASDEAEEEAALDLSAMDALEAEEYAARNCEAREDDDAWCEAEEEVVEDDGPGLDMDAFIDIIDVESNALQTRVAETRLLVFGPEGSDQPAPTNGVEKLRSMPPKELSLVQLVERFAAALHEAQDNAPQGLSAEGTWQGDAEREQALAQALKALTILSRGDNPPAASPAGDQRQDCVAASLTDTERDLHEALSKLQDVATGS